MTNLQKLSPWENGIVGTAAGSIEISILQPVLYWKNATQQNLPFTLNPRLLYRGLIMSMVNMSVLTGLQFPINGMATKLITGGTPRTLSAGEMVASGFIAGAASGLVCGPMELVMIQQQRFGGTIFNTPLRLMRNFGTMSIFRGVSTSCGREGVFTAGYLGISPAVARTLQEKGYAGESQSKVLGAIVAGLICGTLSHPMDTIKTCMQGDVERTTYRTLTQTARLLSEEGLTRFFSGWHWRTGRMICGVFILGECKVRLSPLLFPQYFD